MSILQWLLLVALVALLALVVYLVARAERMCRRCGKWELRKDKLRKGNYLKCYACGSLQKEGIEYGLENPED
jgi:hypothetical protein